MQQTAVVDLARKYNNLGVIRANSGHYDNAEELIRKALELYMDLFGPEHESVRTVRANLLEVQFRREEEID